MNTPEWYLGESERILTTDASGVPAQNTAVFIAKAQVYATLAQASALLNVVAAIRESSASR